MNIVWQTSRSGVLMYPYLISVYGLGAGESNRLVAVSANDMLIPNTATTYAMIRMVFVS